LKLNKTQKVYSSLEYIYFQTTLFMVL